MPAWIGWTTTTASAVKAAPTWNEWCAQQQRVLSHENHKHRQSQSIAFSERELARLSFVRWLYQQGRLDPGLF